MKYILNPKKIPRADSEGFSTVSNYNSHIAVDHKKEESHCFRYKFLCSTMVFSSYVLLSIVNISLFKTHHSNLGPNYFIIQ